MSFSAVGVRGSGSASYSVRDAQTCDDLVEARGPTGRVSRP